MPSGHAMPTGIIGYFFFLKGEIRWVMKLDHKAADFKMITIAFVSYSQALAFIYLQSA